MPNRCPRTLLPWQQEHPGPNVRDLQHAQGCVAVPGAASTAKRSWGACCTGVDGRGTYRRAKEGEQHHLGCVGGPCAAAVEQHAELEGAKACTGACRAALMAASNKPLQTCMYVSHVQKELQGCCTPEHMLQRGAMHACGLWAV